MLKHQEINEGKKTHLMKQKQRMLTMVEMKMKMKVMRMGMTSQTLENKTF
jgi:hypothetical protein